MAVKLTQSRAIHDLVLNMEITGDVLGPSSYGADVAFAEEGGLESRPVTTCDSRSRRASSDASYDPRTRRRPSSLAAQGRRQVASFAPTAPLAADDGLSLRDRLRLATSAVSTACAEKGTFNEVVHQALGLKSRAQRFLAEIKKTADAYDESAYRPSPDALFHVAVEPNARKAAYRHVVGLIGAHVTEAIRSKSLGPLSLRLDSILNAPGLARAVRELVGAEAASLVLRNDDDGSLVPLESWDPVADSVKFNVSTALSLQGPIVVRSPRPVICLPITSNQVGAHCGPIRLEATRTDLFDGDGPDWGRVGVLCLTFSAADLVAWTAEEAEETKWGTPTTKNFTEKASPATSRGQGVVDVIRTVCRFADYADDAQATKAHASSIYRAFVGKKQKNDGTTTKRASPLSSDPTRTTRSFSLLVDDATTGIFKQHGRGRDGRTISERLRDAERRNERRTFS